MSQVDVYNVFWYTNEKKGTRKIKFTRAGDPYPRHYTNIFGTIALSLHEHGTLAYWFIDLSCAAARSRGLVAAADVLNAQLVEHKFVLTTSGATLPENNFSSDVAATVQFPDPATGSKKHKLIVEMKNVRVVGSDAAYFDDALEKAMEAHAMEELRAFQEQVMGSLSERYTLTKKIKNAMLGSVLALVEKELLAALPKAASAEM